MNTSIVSKFRLFLANITLAVPEKTTESPFASLNIPIFSESELMGLVEKWCSGITWNDLIANTSLDEGDVVRIMRRTIDLLAQVPHCIAISSQLKRNASEALKAINRFPVCESDELLRAAHSDDLNPATERIA